MIAFANAGMRKSVQKEIFMTSQYNDLLGADLHDELQYVEPRCHNTRFACTERIGYRLEQRRRQLTAVATRIPRRL